MDNPSDYAPQLVAKLRAFISCIDVTGGVIQDDSGDRVPAADPEWIDLALAYDEACALLATLNQE